MPNTNNPAGRLLRILLDCQKQPKGAQMLTAWSKVFGLEDKDKSSILRSIGGLMRLPAEIKKKIQRNTEVPHEIYLRWLPEVEHAFSILNFEAPWSAFLDRISEKAIHGLEFCDDLLSRTQREVVVNEDELKHLHDEVSELLKECIAASMPADIKAFVLRHLERVERAILEYRFRGAEPLQEAVEAVLGGIILDRQMYDAVTEVGPGKRFWELLGKISILIALADGAQMIQQGVRYLLPGSSTPPTVTQPTLPAVPAAEKR